MSGKVIDTFVDLSVYESFQQTVKYGRHRNHILKNLSGLEI